MKYRQGISFVIITTMVCMMGGGCIETQRVQLDTSDASRQIIIDMIHAHAQNATGFRGYGNSRHAFINEEGKTTQFPFTCTLWFREPADLRLLSHATMRGNIDIGCNEESFWMAIKPELSTYCWGKWDEPLREGMLPFSPKVVLEAIGIVDMNEPENWVLEEEAKTWTLTREFEEEKMIKKLLIDKKEQRISQIQYLDDEWVPLVVADLSGYRWCSDGFYVPTVLRITAYENGERTGWVTIILKNIYADNKIKDKLFKLPPKRGFESVIKVTTTHEEEIEADNAADGR